jgi:hypothetical protein
VERRFKLLLAGFVLLAVGCLILAGVPVMGLSMIMGISVLGSSVLGSSVLGSSVLGTTTTTVMAAYSEALAASQVWVSLGAIMLLVYVELSDPAYGRSRRLFVELRRSWLSVSMLFVVLFGIVVVLKVWTILV